MRSPPAKPISARRGWSTISSTRGRARSPSSRSKSSDSRSMPVTRFAPSPTGYLHLGHAYSALFARDQARRAGGRFLLRIEDIDTARSRPEFETAIIEDLSWLGLKWDGAVRRQSEHMDDYRAALSRLGGLGVTYPCFCS